VRGNAAGNTSKPVPEQAVVFALWGTPALL